MRKERILKKLSLEEFRNKYKNRNHIYCGIKFSDETTFTIMNMSFSYIDYFIKNSKKEVKYIATS